MPGPRQFHAAVPAPCRLPAHHSTVSDRPATHRRFPTTALPPAPHPPRLDTRPAPSPYPGGGGRIVGAMTAHGLGTAVIVAALLTGAWLLVTALRDRPAGNRQAAAMAAVQALVVAQIVVAAVELAGGHRPTSYPTFIGYLVAFFLVIPAGWGLAKLEPTRWGALIAAIACVVDAILIVRLDQVWGHG